LALLLAGACTVPNAGPEPSLAPRPAEAIDPRLPIPGDVPAGPADAALAVQLAALVGEVRAGEAQFNARQAEAERRSCGDPGRKSHGSEGLYDRARSKL
jgi:hypothetical protein